MSSDLFALNVDALQELYAMKYYKVHKSFPKYKPTDSDKRMLILKIKFLTFKENQNAN